jgi:uncharacterized phage infection (PIP) family protein YhgE
MFNEKILIGILVIVIIVLGAGWRSGSTEYRDTISKIEESNKQLADRAKGLERDLVGANKRVRELQATNSQLAESISNIGIANTKINLGLDRATDRTIEIQRLIDELTKGLRSQTQ